jgi:hypothetical protein
MSEQTRREAMKTLAGIATSAGLLITPVTTEDARDVDLVILKSQVKLSASDVEHIRAAWRQAIDGTSITGRVVILDASLDLEFVRSTQ